MTTATITALAIFLGIFLVLSLAASRFNKPTPADYYLAGRSLGPFVLLMTTAATAFSTWTLLGAVGEFYRTGVWFLAFPAWAVVQGMFFWIFGARIWQMSRRFNLITPGDMAEHYYGSLPLRILFAVFGIIGLIPYMLIQVTGGAQALTAITNNVIPYWVGVATLGLLVGTVVSVSGGRGAAWSDTFMGLFFGVVLLGTCLAFISMAGGLDAFRSIAPVAPDILAARGDLGPIIDTCLGLTFGLWIMPQIWQKFCSAQSPSALVKMAALTPVWNAWLMGVSAAVIGMLAHVPGIVDVTESNSDLILPLFYTQHAPLLGSIVVVGVVAAAVSTVNSQMLSSASLLTTDLYLRVVRPDASLVSRTRLGRGTVIGLTALVVTLSFLPASQNFLIPLANNGFAIGSQLVPAALGPLLWRHATRAGALASIITGETTVGIVMFYGAPLSLGPTTMGLAIGLPVFVFVSLITQRQVRGIQHEYHDALARSLHGVDRETRSAAEEAALRDAVR